MWWQFSASTSLAVTNSFLKFDSLLEWIKAPKQIFDVRKLLFFWISGDFINLFFFPVSHLSAHPIHFQIELFSMKMRMIFFRDAGQCCSKFRIRNWHFRRFNAVKNVIYRYGFVNEFRIVSTHIVLSDFGFVVFVIV